MNKLQNLTAEARQNKSYEFDGKTINVILYYSEVNIGWYITIKEGDFTLLNARLTCSKNFLNDYRRKLKWGLQVRSKDGIDPYNIKDLANSRIELYFMNKDEVDYITNITYRYNSELLIHA